jgi:hypothetical protein
MKVVDIANEIYTELGQPTTLSIPPIAHWLRNNIGSLNNKLNESFYVDSIDFEIKADVKDSNGTVTKTEVSDDEKVIFKKLYLIHYYDVQIRSSLGAASTDTIVEIASDGTSVRRVNKIQQSQTYQAAKKLEMEEMNQMVNAYKIKRSCPSQVAGDDTVEAAYDTGSTFDTRTQNNPNL